MNDLVAGRRVSIRRITTDRYGRTVAELSTDGVNVQQFMVVNGLASIYEKYACNFIFKRWKSSRNNFKRR